MLEMENTCLALFLSWSMFSGPRYFYTWTFSWWRVMGSIHTCTAVKRKHGNGAPYNAKTTPGHLPSHVELDQHATLEPFHDASWQTKDSHALLTARSLKCKIDQANNLSSLFICSAIVRNRFFHLECWFVHGFFYCLSPRSSTIKASFSVKNLL
jgi:hypothetical protein